MGLSLKFEDAVSTYWEIYIQIFGHSLKPGFLKIVLGAAEPLPRRCVQLLSRFWCAELGAKDLRLEALSLILQHLGLLRVSVVNLKAGSCDPSEPARSLFFKHGCLKICVKSNRRLCNNSLQMSYKCGGLGSENMCSIGRYYNLQGKRNRTTHLSVDLIAVRLAHLGLLGGSFAT